MGIEPTLSAWKAEVLPLNYTRKYSRYHAPKALPLQTRATLDNLVEGEGFEPSKAEPSDLQSDPFDRSGTPPDIWRCHSPRLKVKCQGSSAKILKFSSTYFRFS